MNPNQPSSQNPTPQAQTSPQASQTVAPELKDANKPSSPPNIPAEPEQVIQSWNAPEFTYTEKPAGWYGLLALFFIVLIIIAVLTRQWLSIAVFAVMGIAVAVMASRKPRMLNYSITTYGVHVGEKRYEFNNFSAYFETDDYGQLVFELLPTKRFAPLVSLPSTAELEKTIEAELGRHLPKTSPRNSLIEKLFKSLRF